VEPSGPSGGSDSGEQLRRGRAGDHGRSAAEAAGPSADGEATREHLRRGLAAHFALPAGFAGLLTAGAVAAALNGRFPDSGVLAVAAVVVAAVSLVAEPVAAPALMVMGWLTGVGFSGPPYAELHPTARLAALTAAVMSASAVAGAGTGLAFRTLRDRSRLWNVDMRTRLPAASAADRASAIGRRRRLTGILAGAAVLPTLTAVLTAARPDLSLADELLIYLVAVVAVAVIGGFWPAVLAAVAASLLLNWYFTPPLHTFTIEEPRNLLALLLFVTVAVTVSSVVHLAANRAVQAARNSAEAASLLALAQTVLGGSDTSDAVLDHLTATFGGRAELYELSGDRWVSAATSGEAPSGDATAARIEARPGLALVTAGQQQPVSPRLLDGFAAQAAAALDRDRLRTEAAQAQALAEGNRIRTALLAAVSHDLRTPLASIKASASSLRQTDVQWSEADQSDLLATIEENADRLDALIGNLLDMSRLQTGSLQPFLRPTAIDEVAPVALRWLGAAATVEMAVPDGLPLVRTDPGLLERVLANVLANALRFSPPVVAPVLAAHSAGDTVVVEVVDRGCGVPDALKPRIFEPFQRLNDRDGSAGVGLGLAVARGFVEAMGGSVTAADTPGGGLTIRITLPVAQKRASSALGTGR
jgi:two-component system, OmpR family, sensor histidine kinase KdpD